MMNKKEYVVRIVQTEDNEGCKIDDMFIELLQYAGLVMVHDVLAGGLTVRCFDLRCPNDKELDSKVWATKVADKMSIYGFNAVVAPSTI